MPARLTHELIGEPVYYQGGTMSDPSVTFVVPTCGRAARQPQLMNEMFYWYTRQTYARKQLLILNDAPEQKLYIQKDLREEHNVHVINYGFKIATLGEKMNLLVLVAAGSVVLVQEDDDISLPWRAEQAVTALHNADYWTPGYWWYAEEGQPMVADGKGVGHNCAAFRRSSLYNRYDNVTHGHDARVHEWANNNLKVNPRHLQPGEENDISYVYRWGVSDLHLSGQGDMEFAYAHADPGPPGTYEIYPVMGRDYLAMHKEAAERYKAAGVKT